MAFANIPQLWAAQVLAVLRAELVYAGPAVVNRDYEGDISAAGDVVTIVGAVYPTIFDYTRNVDMPAPETLTDNERQLIIDQQKAFNFQVDDLDKLQMFPKLQVESAANAAYALQEVADAFIAGKMVAEADPTNAVGTTTTPIAVDEANAYRTLVSLRMKLDVAKVPQQGRWAIVPPFFEGVLTLDDKFIGDTGLGDALMNGRIGRAAGFDLFAANTVPNAGGKYKIVAGHRIATSYAEQLIETEDYRPERRFADAVKGLHVYGAKVIRPEALAVATVTDSSGL